MAVGRRVEIRETYTSAHKINAERRASEKLCRLGSLIRKAVLCQLILTLQNRKGRCKARLSREAAPFSRI